jgi:D-alanyl-D-alanine carboxypeptidase (penicillin-binding protein 5/6)
MHPSNFSHFFWEELRLVFWGVDAQAQRMWKKRFLMLLLVPLLAGAEVEDVNGPPLVTARAWALMDGATGQILDGHDGEVPQKAASTAKMMCLLVVLDLAAQDAAVLDEWVKVSAFAAATKGSRAELAEGEQIQVRHALYALMLPSGNDVANALAEHFNERFEAPGEESPASLRVEIYQTRRRFIAEMNRTARRLGLVKTQYRSALGDGGGAEDATTTAHDLLVLARVAMGREAFRQVVGTVRYEAPIRLVEGGERMGQWENTNELLKLENYDGVKTGTTVTAGACLVASGRHQGRHLLVAVLGSSSSAARYVDARNLFRWGWQQAELGGRSEANP